jgi:Zinc knuckle
MESETPPTTLQQWYDRSIAVDRNWRQFKAEEELFQKRDKGKEKAAETKAVKKPNKPWQKTFTPRPQVSIPRPQMMPANSNTNDAMDVNRVRRPPIRCYKCGKMGHMAKECRSSAQVRQAWTERLIAAIENSKAGPSEARIEEVPEAEEELKDNEGQ